MTEQFDAVLAEMDDMGRADLVEGGLVREWRTRLAAAHAAEKEAAERDATLRELLFDGYAVYAALTDDAKLRTSPENVADALDAMNRAVRERVAIDACMGEKGNG